MTWLWRSMRTPFSRRRRRAALRLRERVPTLDPSPRTTQVTSCGRREGPRASFDPRRDCARYAIGDPDCARRGQHIVHADDVGAAEHGSDDGGLRALEPVRHWQVEQLADERLARGADQDRMPELLELLEASHDLPVVV